ncbi:hypothetical protein CEXT_679751 [Caerostris extrusa]|uniref:Uncharacterized protein n=1 Tax=Caerostris extrusa TaxID=172846 RepID=A0AAV4XDI6_CAEEX|nr:hypothetical protein CEXT_679751 [Caerostris extrusa]
MIFRLPPNRVLQFWLLTEIASNSKILKNFNRKIKEDGVLICFKPQSIYFDKLHKRFDKPVHPEENTDMRLDLIYVWAADSSTQNIPYSPDQGGTYAFLQDSRWI